MEVQSLWLANGMIGRCPAFLLFAASLRSSGAAPLTDNGSHLALLFMTSEVVGGPNFVARIVYMHFQTERSKCHSTESAIFSERLI